MMEILEISKIIKKRKSELGLTIDGISIESGVGKRTIYRMLAGEDIRYSSLLSVLHILGLSISISTL